MDRHNLLIMHLLTLCKGHVKICVYKEKLQTGAFIVKLNTAQMNETIQIVLEV
jgi:hypothetical protein